MPRVVDADERRRVILAAVRRLVIRSGVEAASLRNVAAEAGLNVGSVRHYFVSHEEMLVAALAQLEGVVEQRVRSHLPRYEGVASVAGATEISLDVLEEFLPLDEERRSELIVYFAFGEAARSIPALRTLSARLVDAVRAVCREMCRAAGSAQVEEDGAALAALLDGLGYGILQTPDAFTREQVRAILRRQWGLVRLAGPPSDAWGGQVAQKSADGS